MPTPERILIIRPSALGDVCRTVPVLASLRRAYPDAQIDWLVQDSFADAIAHHPALTRTVPFPRKALGHSSRRGNPLPSITWMNKALRSHPYDLVIDAQGLLRSAIFARWTGAKARVGYANAQEGAPLFYSRRVTAPRDAHAVDRMLTLIKSIGIEPIRDMRLYADPAELSWADAQPWASDRFAVLAPTSRWPAKQWPARRFAELAKRLLARGIPRVVIAGGPNERNQIAPLLDWAAHERRAVDLVGHTSIARAMAIISRASLVVANDSAALHMAVGFDRPLVALFGPTKAGKVGPYRRDDDVIQHPRPGDRFEHKLEALGKPMMERITVEEAADACAARLDR